MPSERFSQLLLYWKMALEVLCSALITHYSFYAEVLMIAQRAIATEAEVNAFRSKPAWSLLASPSLAKPLTFARTGCIVVAHAGHIVDAFYPFAMAAFRRATPLVVVLISAHYALDRLSIRCVFPARCADWGGTISKMPMRAHPLSKRFGSVIFLACATLPLDVSTSWGA